MCNSRKVCIDIITGPQFRLGSCVRNTDGFLQNVTWHDTVLLTASHLTVLRVWETNYTSSCGLRYSSYRLYSSFVETDGTKQTEQPAATQRVGLHDLQQDTLHIVTQAAAKWQHFLLP
jgi:hypothetical protein